LLTFSQINLHRDNLICQNFLSPLSESALQPESRLRAHGGHAQGGEGAGKVSLAAEAKIAVGGDG